MNTTLIKSNIYTYVFLGFEEKYLMDGLKLEMAFLTGCLAKFAVMLNKRTECLIDVNILITFFLFKNNF